MKLPSIVQWKQLGFTLSVIIVLNLLISLGARVLFPNLEFPIDCRSGVIASEAACATEGGKWRAETRIAPEKSGAEVALPAGYCENLKCEVDFRDQQSVQERNIFLISFSGGTVALVIGLLLSIEAIAMGLLFGGIIQVFVATVGYWNAADELIRFLVVVAGFIALMLIGAKKYYRRSGS